MKKVNNKYRNNNYSNQIYSLNYKFDSSSPAGKFNGTALDLIKRYNELAKDCVSNNDYVSAEVYRQYAEHYRKIVTDINEKKMQRASQRDAEIRTNEVSENTASENAVAAQVEDAAAARDGANDVSPAENEAAPAKKEFKVIEIKTAEPVAADGDAEEAPKTKKRVCRRKNAAVEAAATVM